MTVSIDAPFDKVARDLADPRTHPLWATEFFDGEAELMGNGEVKVNVPRMGGMVKCRIDSDIEKGVIDLYLGDINKAYGPPIPVRLIPNGDGTDVLWTLMKPPGLADGVWQEGLVSMKRELMMLKKRHEGSSFASNSRT